VSAACHRDKKQTAHKTRQSACIADPGQWSITRQFRDFVIKLSATPEVAGNLRELDQSVLERMVQMILGSPSMQWKIIQCGFWVHGNDNLRDYLRSADQFTVDGRRGDLMPDPDDVGRG
jgi:hypothetical protein